MSLQIICPQELALEAADVMAQEGPKAAAVVQPTIIG